MLSPCIILYVFSTSGVFSTSEGYHDSYGGYHEYTGVGGVQYIGEITMSTSGDTIIHVGEQIDKSL